MKCACLLLALGLLAPLSAAGAFDVSNAFDRVVITEGSQPVATYVFADKTILRPYFANLHAPGGIQVTRNHPPQPGKDATDHDTMHPGVWLAFGDISSEDFWRNKGLIRHRRFTESPAVHEERVVFATENELQATDGRTLATQLSRVTLAGLPQGYLLVWEAMFTPTDREIVFGDQEEMGLGVRVATALTEKNGGVLRASSGATNAKATWGKAFDWCDYSGVFEGRQVGVTLMPDPGNFRPSWFHNRDYGLMVANPFGRKAMNQGETSRVAVRRGESLRLRFGVLLHAGAAVDLAKAYREFLAIIGSPLSRAQGGR